MVVTPVDQQDLGIGSLERACCGDAGETTTDDQNALPPQSFFCNLHVPLRKRLGQSCSHKYLMSNSSVVEILVNSLKVQVSGRLSPPRWYHHAKPHVPLLSERYRFRTTHRFRRS